MKNSFLTTIICQDSEISFDLPQYHTDSIAIFGVLIFIYSKI